MANEPLSSNQSYIALAISILNDTNPVIYREKGENHVLRELAVKRNVSSGLQFLQTTGKILL